MCNSGDRNQHQGKAFHGCLNFMKSPEMKINAQSKPFMFTLDIPLVRCTAQMHCIYPDHHPL